MKKAEMARLDVLSIPDGFDPIESQRLLQEKILNGSGNARSEMPVLTKAAATEADLAWVITANAFALTNELSELVDTTAWKWWKRYDNIADDPAESSDHTERKYEVVDAFHFLLNIAIALGMTWDEFMQIFYTKQVENHRRQDEGY
jgi:dimeric dUTPase (all-alpha-NTP-PPase superfamily)